MFILGTKSMVIFKDSATADEIAYIMELVKHAGVQIIHTYDSVIKGFAATLSDTHLHALEGIARHTNSAIDYIESDGGASIFNV